MVTKNTENNANNALNIIPESASTAVDNDEKYLSFALVLAITIMDNLVKLIGTDGFVLYTYTLQDTATARAVFNELARRLKNFNRQEEVYTTDYLTFRMKYIYGVTLFEHDSKSILNLFDKKGYPVLSESGEPVLLMICILTFKHDYMAATPQKSFFTYMNIVCYLHTLPRLWKRRNVAS